MVCAACSESEWTRFWMSALPLASVALLASSAFHAMTPRTQAVMTSAKVMTTAVDVTRRSGPPGSGGFRWGIPRLDDRARPRCRQRAKRNLRGDRCQRVNGSIRETTDPRFRRVPLREPGGRVAAPKADGYSAAGLPTATPALVHGT